MMALTVAGLPLFHGFRVPVACIHRCHAETLALNSIACELIASDGRGLDSTGSTISDLSKSTADGIRIVLANAKRMRRASVRPREGLKVQGRGVPYKAEVFGDSARRDG